MQVRSITIYACPDADYSLPVKSAIKDKQLELVELVGGQRTSVRTMDRRHQMRKSCFELH